MAIEHPRILLVDSYDSFTLNLASLLKQSIPNCIIYIIKNDAFTIAQLLPFLPAFSAVIVGPGPGSPENDRDVGLIKDLWNLGEHSVLPMFGVCLGLQSLCVAHGAELKRLDVVKHGQISRVQHTGTFLFQGVGTVRAVRYHSLHVVLRQGGCIEQLAWVDDGAENGHVVMAVRHTSKPFWAVQYHPESVCTRGGGVEVIQNFWQLAQDWARKVQPRTTPWNSSLQEMFGDPWPSFLRARPRMPISQFPGVTTAVLDLPHITVAAVCELFGVCNEERPFVCLDSAAQPGRFSIVGSLMPESLQITHFVGDNSVSLTRGRHTSQEILGDRDIWTWLSDFMASRRVHEGHPDIPFWGGLIGLLSYEMGAHSLCTVKGKRCHPDVNFVFVERSVVIDSATGRVFVQSLIPNDHWIAETTKAVSGLNSQPMRPGLPTGKANITLPNKDRYLCRINAAKEYISAGDSYELCLTARTTVSLPKSTSWRRYQALRSKNPAPYSAYLRLHPTTLLSSSPERFLSTSRPPDSVFHLRPIKGTVRKAPGVTRAVAEEALAGSVKEVAENLMIVDLIRHDLHTIVGEDVEVKQFCVVEEYETVWQLVSVIEGRPSVQDGLLGWEMLRSSLPPGSMTGAPKKRSVEILQTLEDDERGIYSGVFGYWCVGMGSDWSVTIRSCFKLDDDSSDSETWEMGAGGAITALSDAEAEWEEMVVKLNSVVGAFT
ncbi:ADC synthase [Roridomyces roridus]|uniref:aminodeoxychorismate synthase n=1 Tax=Roridomyces roridus TaxID=1738132 RepID=A0AAD7BUP7_9AGAR|nr:ADC synthase [Roridomyces roridus]